MIVTNGRITFVYWLLQPVGIVAAQFFAGYAVAMLARQLGAPWISIDLEKVASTRSDLIRYPLLLLIGLLPLLAYDFFTTGAGRGLFETPSDRLNHAIIGFSNSS
jgi:hypothetical protein